MKKALLKKALLVLLPLIALALEVLPNSIVMHFMADPAEGGSYAHYCSYFDFLVVGYGNWGPMLTGVLTGVILLLGIVYLARSGGKLVKWIRNLAITAFAFSLTALFFREMTLYGYMISALLLAQAGLAHHLK